MKHDEPTPPLIASWQDMQTLARIVGGWDQLIGRQLRANVVLDPKPKIDPSGR